MSKADVIINISTKYCKEVKRLLMIAEEDRQYGKNKV